MTKKYYTLPERTKQPTIDDEKDFDFEDGFCYRLNKIQAIADLFFCQNDDEIREITGDGCHGIHNVLTDTVKEIRAICYKMLKWEGGAR